MKKFILSALVALFCITNAALAQGGAYWTDRGNYDISWYNSNFDEFSISNARELAGLAYLVNNGYATFTNKKVILENDLDMNSFTWKSIGVNSSACFRGTFDGQGYTIKNVKILLDSGVYPYYGFFCQLYGAEIKNVVLNGVVRIYYDSDSHSNTIAGSFAAYTYNSKFYNCTSNFNILYQREKTNNFEYDVSIGGIVGEAQNTEFFDCIHNGDIEYKFGRSGFNSEFYNSRSEVYIGGIVGSSRSSSFKYCGNKSEVLSVDVAGSKNTDRLYVTLAGVVAYLDGNTKLKSCFNNAEKVNVTSRSNECGVKFGGIAGSAVFYTYDEGGLYNCYSSTNWVNLILPDNSTFICGGISSHYNSSSDKYAANYSPKDISGTSLTKVKLDKGYSGSNSYTKNEMLSTDFLSDLNIYPQINGDGEIWIRDTGFPYVKRTTVTNISDIKINGTECSYDNDLLYDLQGNQIVNPQKGVYILNGKKFFIE